MDANNRYKVPVKSWRKWSVNRRRVFNAVYREMKTYGFGFRHPKQSAPLPEHWKTTAWNAAWTAGAFAQEAYGE